jgi:hypothetical protein
VTPSAELLDSAQLAQCALVDFIADLPRAFPGQRREPVKLSSVYGIK